MNKSIVVIVVFLGVVLVVFLIGTSLLFWGWDGMLRPWGGMMGPGHMMGPWGGFWLMWLFPLGVLLLLILGIIWLVQALAQPRGGGNKDEQP